jgi:hypothetical protein
MEFSTACAALIRVPCPIVGFVVARRAPARTPAVGAGRVAGQPGAALLNASRRHRRRNLEPRSARREGRGVPNALWRHRRRHVELQPVDGRAVPGYRVRRLELVTTLLDPVASPKGELAELFLSRGRSRW